MRGILMLTHREARKQLGSRTSRRIGTNRKNIPGRPAGPKGQVAFKYRYARPTSRKVAVRVARLVKESMRSNGQD